MTRQMLYPKREAHDTAVWALAAVLRAQGCPTAQEVGVPGGRVDLVTYTAPDGDTPLCAIEVKTNPGKADEGIGQIVRYGDLLGVDRRLLAVDVRAETPGLAAKAAEAGVDLWVEDFAMLKEVVSGLRSRRRLSLADGLVVIKPGEWPATTAASNAKRAASRGDHRREVAA